MIVPSATLFTTVDDLVDHVVDGLTSAFSKGLNALNTQLKSLKQKDSVSDEDSDAAEAVTGFDEFLSACVTAARPGSPLAAAANR